MERINISFNDLRRIKHALPHGSMQRIAELLNTEADTIRNYFGADNFKVIGDGVHYEQGGAEGGLVTFDDPTILRFAQKILAVRGIKLK
ncbi:MAG: DNA-binding protein [Prevotellaceae bacterium]|jgi:hypothetical protein|nr:DNA-binding protein [Prevotellaceae bacterium]